MFRLLVALLYLSYQGLVLLGSLPLLVFLVPARVIELRIIIHLQNIVSISKGERPAHRWHKVIVRVTNCLM